MKNQEWNAFTLSEQRLIEFFISKGLTWCMAYMLTNRDMEIWGMCQSAIEHKWKIACMHLCGADVIEFKEPAPPKDRRVDFAYSVTLASELQNKIDALLLEILKLQAAQKL